ncbi:hypothetical protein AAFF_G00423730 [Aldrovandia affinis]|uniref:Uncharacterized protein n=1 Tax=Aldrovandia affinis TaxID=143900 RepID=A0AAD7X069_9TELE|nr:hypothetical protein AAFF_G00423730 [Aldrovandia affinis]
MFPPPTLGFFAVSCVLEMEIMPTQVKGQGMQFSDRGVIRVPSSTWELDSRSAAINQGSSPPQAKLTHMSLS